MKNRVLFNDYFITILCDRTDLETIKLTQSIPYIHKNRINTEFKTSIRNIGLVLKLFRNIDETNIHLAPIAVQKLFDIETQRRKATEVLISEGPTFSHSWLWSHQQLGVELAEINNRYAFFYDTRTGKTPMSLQIIQEDIIANPTHKWLVLCPLILIENAWLKDARRMFPKLPIVNLHATTKSDRLLQFKKKGSLYLSNIESFIDYRQYMEEMGFYGCIVDESSTMKSSSSKFGLAAVEFASIMKKWYLLSGVPAPNGEHEYYRQIQSIDFYGIHQSYAQFILYFFNDVSRNPQYKKLCLKPERRDELLGLLSKYSIYVDKEDVLTTPGRDFERVEFDLPLTLKGSYNSMKEELYLELKDNVIVTAPSVAAKLNKLNQITSGFVIDTQAIKYNKMLRESGSIAREKPESFNLSEYRFAALYKLLATLGNQQVIIWANYHLEFERIERALVGKCGCVSGRENITQKNENLRNFAAGKIQYLIANPASADKGLTLTNSHIAIYFSMNYSYELFKQSMERIYGSIISQPNRCTYYIFIANGTIDGIIYDAVMHKSNLSSAILDHLKGGKI